MNYYEKIGRAIELAAEKLPEEYSISLFFQKDSGSVELINSEGDVVYFPTNHEWLDEEITDAIPHAIHIASFPV